MEQAFGEDSDDVSILYKSVHFETFSVLYRYLAIKNESSVHHENGHHVGAHLPPLHIIMKICPCMNKHSSVEHHDVFKYN